MKATLAGRHKVNIKLGFLGEIGREKLIGRREHVHLRERVCIGVFEKEGERERM